MIEGEAQAVFFFTSKAAIHVCGSSEPKTSLWKLANNFQGTVSSSSLDSREVYAGTAGKITYIMRTTEL
jgi:hypothetical protein